MWSVILRNAASGYLRVFASLAVGFLVTPLIVHELGTSDYGLWVLVIALAGYFPILDVGLRLALTRDTAVRRANGEEDAIRESITAFFLIFVGIGVCIFLVSLALAALMPHVFNVEEGQASTGQLLLLVVGLSWALQFPSNVAVGVLYGYERYDGVNALVAASRLIQGAATAIALLSGAGVEALAFILIGVELPRTVANFVLAYRLVPAFSISLRNVNWSYLRGASKRGVSYFVNTSNGMLISRADEIIIGVFLSVSSVGVYAVALRLVNLSRTFAGQLDEVLLPVVSRLTNTSRGRKELGAVVLKATRVTGSLAAGITLMLVVFGDPFLDLWIGSEVESAYHPLVILAVMSYLAMLQSLNVRLTLASDQHKLATVLTMATMLVNITASIILIHQWQLIGVAAGSLIAVCTSGAVRIWMGCRIAHLSPLTFIRSGVLPSLVPALLAGLLGFGLQEVRAADTWPMLFAEAGVVLVCYGVPVVLLSFPIQRSWQLLLETFAFTFRSPRQVASAGHGEVDQRTAGP